MTNPTSDVAFTKTVKAIQSRRGSRASYEKLEQRGGWQNRVTPELVAFLAQRDSMFLGTASGDGRPYIQHRGGPRGFLRAIDDRTLAFADFKGNRQYISLGNLAENDRAFIFLIDHQNRRRFKLWGRARVVEGDADLLAKLVDPAYDAQPEQAIAFTLEAWDKNCPQHIPVLLAEDDVRDALAELNARIAALEGENSALRARLSA